jgi:MFS family permease
MGIFSSLSHEQREATAILQIGTFLEYFDLMLYVHMAVLLNELFFPKTDPHTARLLSAMAFCTPFVFRPLGALIFGYIGDTVGRKATVIITTAMMALSCVAMANLPTYAQVGIAASWGITICRIVQGLSSMGEIIGAQIYLTELVKPPANYPVVCLIACSDCFGALMALAVATGVFALGLEWRVAFWAGATIALVGFVARTALRETPEFINAKQQLKQRFSKVNIDPQILQEDVIVNQKVNKKTVIAYFLTYCGSPACFYFIYVYCGEILKNSFNYSPQQIVSQNLIVALVEFLGVVCLVYLSCKIHPLKIVKTKAIIFSIIILLAPFLLSHVDAPHHILMIQSVSCLCWLNIIPATPIFFKHFPVFKRFTCASLIYALSRGLMYVITSVGLVYLTEKFNHYGLLIIFIPLIIGFWFGFLHCEQTEKAAENYLHKNSLNLATDVVQ